MPNVVLTSPGWIQRLFIRPAGSANEAAEVNIRKYLWQAGMDMYEEAMKKIIRHCIADAAKITCNCLLLGGANETRGLIRWADELCGRVKANPKNKLRRLRPVEAGDTHCQVNDLPLAQIEILDWPDTIIA